MYKLNENFFSTINSNEKAYFLGLLYADGNNYITDKIRQVSIELQEEDKKILELFKNAIETDKPLKYRKSKKQNGYNIKSKCGLVICNKKISKDLYELGCVPNKSLKLKFPASNKLDYKYIRSFIRGYFDGDGGISISKQNKVKSSICGSKCFIKKLFSFFKKMKLNVKIYINKKVKNFAEIYFQGIEDNIKLYNFLYDESNLFIDRKKNTFNQIFNLKKGQG